MGAYWRQGIGGEKLVVEGGRGPEDGGRCRSAPLIFFLVNLHVIIFFITTCYGYSVEIRPQIF